MQARFPKHVTRPFAALLALTLAAGAAGCGNDRAVVAHVGDAAITTGDYYDFGRGLAFQYTGPPDTAKAAFLDDLIRQELLLVYGHESGILEDSLIAHDRAKMEEQFMRTALIAELVPRAVAVSDAEVRRFYAMRDSATRVRLIVVPSRQMMDKALEELAAGDDFEVVANRFNVSGRLPAGGDLGYILPGTLDEPLDTALRTGRVGERVGPTTAPGGGWYLAQIVDRVAGTRDSLAAEAPQIQQALQQRKRRALSSRAFEQLRDQYRVTLTPGAVQAFFGHFNQPDLAPGVGDPDAPAGDLARPLATYDSLGTTRTYTLADALDDLDDPQGERPDPTMLSSFGPWIESRVVNRAMRIEGRRRHLMDTPRIADALDMRFRTELLNSVYAEAVERVAQPTEDDVRQAYAMRATPDMPAFDDLDPQMRAQLQFDGMEVARRRRLFELTDSLRAAIPVTVDQAVLAKLPWPVPARP